MTLYLSIYIYIYIQFIYTQKPIQNMFKIVSRNKIKIKMVSKVFNTAFWRDKNITACMHWFP